MAEFNEIISAEQASKLDLETLRQLIKSYGGTYHHFEKEPSLARKLQELSLATYAAKMQSDQDAELQSELASKAAADAGAATALQSALEAQAPVAPTAPEEPEAEPAVDHKARIEALVKDYIGYGMKVSVEDGIWHFSNGGKSDSGHVTVSNNMLRMCARGVMSASGAVGADGFIRA
jgi:hypothetical protein